jgi:hypothetical protein
MRVPPDNFSNKVVDLTAIFSALSALPSCERSRVAMSLASEILQYAAYETATDHAPDEVAEIVMIAAQLERSAVREKQRQTFEDAQAALGKRHLQSQ